MAHSFKMGALGGTRAGFFAMGFPRDSDEFYVCHRGLNRLYYLDKQSLQHRPWLVQTYLEKLFTMSQHLD
jgi:hypothetical protein